MASARVEVELAAGTLMPSSSSFLIDHGRTDTGVGVDAEGTGADLLLVSVGLCVLNDVLREAGDVVIEGIRVRVSGEFDTDTWSSSSISYEVEVDSPADAPAIDELIAQVEAVAEVPRLLAGAVKVERR